MTKRSWQRNNPYKGNVTQKTKRFILSRDKNCRECGMLPSTDVDHIIPSSLGGTDNITNLQGLCAECHQMKTKQEARNAYNARQQSRKMKPEPHPGDIH